MPYFITDKAESCAGWATIKEDGEVIGCHKTKSEAVKHMVAVSLAEEMEPGGERAVTGAVIVDIDDTLIHRGQPIKRVIDYVNALPGRKYIITGRMQSQHDATVAALRDAGVQYSGLFMKQTDEPTSTFKKRVAQKLKSRQKIALAIDNDEKNRAAFSSLGIATMNPASIKNEERAVNAKVPEYMRAAARRGLEYVSQGKGGDGLKQQTINEARKMAAGEISDDKWIRIAAWIARHLDDLDSPEAKPEHPNYPSAGVVAHLLWGSGPSKSKAQNAMDYAQGVVERIRKEERHLPGKHDQSSHAHGGSSKVAGPKEEIRPYVGHKEAELPSEEWATTANEVQLTDALEMAYEKYGYNDKPTVSDAEFKRLKDSGATVIYRGVEDSDSGITAKEMSEDFKNGDKHYVGAGYHGNGTYTSTSRETAVNYSTYNGRPGQVIAMAIRPEARFIHESNIGIELQRIAKKTGYDSEVFAFLDGDPSAAAVHLGFDGIVRQNQPGEDHYIILNRSAVVVAQGAG